MQARPAILSVPFTLVSDLPSFLKSALRSRNAPVAENLCLRKQRAFYREPKATPQPLTDAARLTLVFWSRLFDRKGALQIVKPETLIGRHRKGFRLFWRWKCKRGRRPLPQNIRESIARMSRENPTNAMLPRRVESFAEAAKRKVVGRAVLGGLHHEYAWGVTA